ncbi:hypothetical protein PUR61_30985, partial [Streptomyces sp. BE20]|nr:hypothetical protein [Streptomyces sp. BE20]
MGVLLGVVAGVGGGVGIRRWLPGERFGRGLLRRVLGAGPRGVVRRLHRSQRGPGRGVAVGGGTGGEAGRGVGRRLGDRGLD